jgi:beta-phosphoglucomutase-like phosphatase (HAD superfamily)
MAMATAIDWIGRILTILLDWDDTLAFNNTAVLLPGAYAAVEALHAAGHRLVLFSHNREAARFAQRSGINRFLSQVVHCTHSEKLDFRRLDPPPVLEDLLLFEDTPAIVHAFHAQGLHARRVRKRGLTFDHLVRARLLPPDVVYNRSPD